MLYTLTHGRAADSTTSKRVSPPTLVYGLVAESSLLCGERGNELATKVGDAGDDAVPDELGAPSNETASMTLDTCAHVISGLGEVAALAMEDALGDDPGVGGAGGEDTRNDGKSTLPFQLYKTRH